MVDYNGDGKVDAAEHALTAFLIDEAEKNSSGNNRGSSGCCGPTVAMFLMAVILPVVLTVVFVAH